MPEYFTLEEFRDLGGMDDEGKYSDATIERAAAYIVAVIERVVGTSFVPRTFTRTVPLVNGSPALSAPFVLEVTDQQDVTTGSSYPFGGTSNVSVTYRAGYSETPPADIKEAAMQGTRARVLDTASNARINDRTSQMTNEAGGTTTYVLAGMERPTGYPDVDAVILGWRRRLFGLGFI